MGVIRRTAIILLLSAAAFLGSPARPSHAESGPRIMGLPTQGAAGIREAVADMMRRQAALGNRRQERDQESEFAQPDRTHLPQNPTSPAVAQMPVHPPGFQPVRSDAQPFSPQVVGTSFTGATLHGINPTSSYPPDDMGAVGPSQYFVFVNGRLVTFNKATGVADGVVNADPDVFFFSVLNGSSTSDPRIRYDRLSGRWILIIINVSTPNRILLAVTDAGSAAAITPSTVFTFFFINIATAPPAISNTCFADYPTLGVDANALYIGTNNFCGASQVFNSTDGFVVRKSSILGNGPIVTTVFRGLAPSASAAGPYTPQGVDNFDPASTEGYFVGVDNAQYGLLQMRRVSNPGGTPSISGNVSITVPTTSAPLLVPHLGNSRSNNGRLDALDDRLFAAHIRGGRLWTAQNIGVDNTGVATGTLTRDGSRWYEFSVPVGSGTPTIVQSGTVFTASASNLNDQRYYWIPSVMVSGQGHAAIGFSTAGTSEHVNAATAGRLAGDAGGTMQAPVLFTGSSTAYNPSGDTGGPYGRRWGDYSYTSLDPLDDQTLWTIQQFCDTTNSYGVRVAKLIPPPPATPSALADVTAGQNPVTLTLSGTSVSGSGFYDPGANLPGVPAFSHLAAAISNDGATGTPPAVVSAAYLDPSTITLVLDASAATPNLPGEKYTVTVTNPDGQTAAAAVVHVISGVPVATLAAGPSLSEGDAGTSPFGFTVNLSAAAAQPVTVRYQTSDGTATASDNDYQAAVDSIVIPAGQSSGAITVNVNGDTKYESSETFGVGLTSVTNAALGSPSSATGTILNDDQPPAVSVGGVSLAEGNSGPTAFVFGVSLSQASGLPVSADYFTQDGSATVANNDYQPATGTVTIPAGTLSQPVTVQVNGDATQEPDETFTLNLHNLGGALPGTLQGTGMILNDDGVPSLSIGSVTLPEGNTGTTPFAFVVSLSNPTAQAVTVHYQTEDSTATVADNDYQQASGVLTIPAEALGDTIRVLVTGDSCGEPDEHFRVALSGADGAALAGATGVGTILNDDDVVAPSVAVLSPNGGEGLIIGTGAAITWTAADSGGVRGVDIYLSRDGGATYPEVLASGIPNSGSFSWIVTDPAAPAGSAFVLVKAHDGGCNTGSDTSDAGFEIISSPAAVAEGQPIKDFALTSIRPNPSAGAVRIDYQLPRRAPVRLSVLDVQGREVAVLLDGTLSTGRYHASWPGPAGRGATPAGIYFVRYQAPGKHFTRRLALIR